MGGELSGQDTATERCSGAGATKRGIGAERLQTGTHGGSSIFYYGLGQAEQEVLRLKCTNRLVRSITLAGGPHKACDYRISVWAGLSGIFGVRHRAQCVFLFINRQLYL